MIDDETLKGLMKWGYKIARKFEAAYGDTIGSFEGSVASGLTRAWKTWDSERGPFDSHAKHVIKQELHGAMKRSGPLGYRFDQDKPDNREGAPIISRMETAESEIGHEIEGFCLPVGWEVDYQDFVDFISRDLAPQERKVIRMMYLECKGQKQTGVCSHLGLSDSRVSFIHKSAISNIRQRLGVSNA